MSFNGTALITGGTSGIGFHCALHLARQHPEYLVVIASRTSLNAAAALINDSLSQNNVTYLPLDLSSFAKIRSFIRDWEAKKYPPIRALLLNAGLQFPGGVRITDDGIEATFGINHVGHALLFYLILPHLADRARIIITSSGTHDPAKKTGIPDAKYNTAEELAHPTPETAKNSGRQRYASSKLTNVMWTYALHRRLGRISGKKTLTVIAFDPGMVPGTGLGREAAPILRWVWIHVMPHAIPLLRRVINDNVHTPQESGTTLAWLATSADVEGVSGVYYEGRMQIRSSEDSYDETKQDDLWKWTAKITATNEEEIGRFEMAN
jgi:NAD(P)-dependent dehydrogenase (short-subunit alcohol dehydrogenase family)